ncbi:MAG: DUF4382 domain-containing protein [Candidatus Marinimicrobia bacterium]|nr:DUF4382 domain-containing protein [Candidatus Neomarinimicrobiota bacterium]
MKKYLMFLVVISLALFVGCDNDSEEEASSGQIVIRAFDAPFRGDVEHINLNIIEVSVHKSVSESDSDTSAQWITLSDADTTIDFLELVNGEMATLIQTQLEVGHYSQLRLLLGDSSSIVIDGNSYDLKIPSGSQSGVKLNLGFSIEPDEITELYLDFDAERSINKHPTQDQYTLRPIFRVFKSVLSGTIGGTVTDTSGVGVQNVSIYAVAGGDSVATLTNESGAYKLILLSGTYSISAVGYELSTDTTYQAVELKAEDHLTDFDFIVE